MKPLYINGMGCISPQPTFDLKDLPFETKEYVTSRLSCIEPDYTPFIDPKASRRMGRLLKYGTTAGLQALKDSCLDIKPDAICTGTGFGLLDDSGKFLMNVIEANEGVVSPTAFIQSTHNTVSSNIALMVSCHAHNNTFAHKGFSFESALTDAQMLAGESDAINNILVGAYDEVTGYSQAIMHRLGLLREDSSNLHLLSEPGKGTIAGEGAAFFVMGKAECIHTYALYRGNRIVYKPKTLDALKAKVESLLKINDLRLSDIDVVISGLCGDVKRDAKLAELNSGYFQEQTILGYKHLCGEYMTSTGFALWAAAMIAREGEIPAQMMLKDKGRKPRHILICNAYKDDYTMILVSVA
jgi:3-oxoacyl-[acyl-carrier-protein] synthase II